MEADRHTYTLILTLLCAILGDGEENGLTWQVYILYVQWCKHWVPVHMGKYRVWHKLSVVTHFSLHLDLITSLSSSNGNEI